MTSRVLDTIEEYPALGTKSVNPKQDARKNLGVSKPPLSTVGKSFSGSNRPLNNGQNSYVNRGNGPRAQQPYWSGYNNRPNSQRAGTQQANSNPMNATHTQRDENPEINDTRFLQWTVSAYKEILRDNCHLLNVSSTFRPHSLTNSDSPTTLPSLLL
jgi:hypothetical protein